MSARLTISVSGKVRWLNVKPGALINNAINRVVEEANRLNSEIVPKGKTGQLQASFRSEQTERSVRFYWGAEYAKFVDEGTKESTGRYVPTIGKRLVKGNLGPRQQVYREAKSWHMEGARAALTTPIGEMPEEMLAAKGKFVPGGLLKPKVSMTKLKKGGTKGRGPGFAFIAEELTGTEKKHVIRHELAHAVQWRSGEPWGKSPKEGEAWKRSKKEREAELMAYAAGMRRGNIGSHPGIKAQHFRQKMADSLKPIMLQFTRDEIKRGFHT